MSSNAHAVRARMLDLSDPWIAPGPERCDAQACMDRLEAIHREMAQLARDAITAMRPALPALSPAELAECLDATG